MFKLMRGCLGIKNPYKLWLSDDRKKKMTMAEIAKEIYEK